MSSLSKSPSVLPADNALGDCFIYFVCQWWPETFASLCIVHSTVFWVPREWKSDVPGVKLRLRSEAGTTI